MNRVWVILSVWVVGVIALVFDDGILAKFLVGVFVGYGTFEVGTRIQKWLNRKCDPPLITDKEIVTNEGLHHYLDELIKAGHTEITISSTLHGR